MDRVAFSIFGIDVMWYGILMASGMILGTIIALKEAKRIGISEDSVLDLAIIAIPMGLLGARLYYVIFQWDHYKDNIMEIFNLRKGGLAIYGGVIAAIITCAVVAKVKKKNFWQMADTGCLGVILGQIIGRWGNFFNREAFGGDTDGLFAMKINTWDHAVNGVNVPSGVSFIDEAGQYIQVQPTFLYESFLNLCLLVVIMIFRKKKKFHGEVFLWYMGGYGIIRAFVESMRTDQLILGNTGIPVSQLLAVLLAISSTAIVVYMRIKKKDMPAIADIEDEYDDFVDETVNENK